MRRAVLILVGAALLSAVPQALFATGPSNLREIELTDGTSLRAEILSLHDGVFRLRSPALGEIEVPESHVKKIAIHPPAAGQTAPAPASTTEAGAHAPLPGSDLVESLVRDPSFREQALSLEDDPAVQDILSDQATMDAIRAGDIDALANNPKIQELMRHPTVRALSRREGRP